MPHAIEIRPAVIGDAQRIAALAIQVFLDTYAIDGIERVFASYVFSEFTPERIGVLMADPRTHLLVAERGHHLLGMAVVNIGRGNDLVASAKAAELQRLYILHRSSGSGLGTRMLAAAERACSDRGVEALWLTTWIGNSRALAFYKRHGYRDAGPAYFEHAGARYENRLLAKALA